VVNQKAEMNIHNPAQPYYRARAHSNLFRQLSGRQDISRSGDRKVWRAVGKMLLVFSPLVLAINLGLASCSHTLEQSVQAVSNVRHERVERQISLRAKKEQLSSPERVRIIAAQKLSLYVPDQEQVKVL
jgi:hypothetical protein